MSNENKLPLGRIYEDFARGIAVWYSGGVTPPLASQDTLYFMQLQSEKLKKLGLTASVNVVDRTHNDNVGVVTRDDSVFENYIDFDEMRLDMTFTSGSKKLYSKTERTVLYQTVLRPRQGVSLSPKMPIRCPHCGAATTIGSLWHGCEYCDTKFLTKELYPKVTCFYFARAIHMTGGELKKEILPFVLGGMVLLPVIRLISGGLDASLIGYVISGALLGYVCWAGYKILSVFGMLGKSLRGMSNLTTSLKFIPYMRKADPSFSFE